MACYALLSLPLLACQDEDEEGFMILEQRLAEAELDTSSAYIHNHPLATGSGHLHVLAIGNSFTVDALYFVPDLLKGAGVDAATYSIYFTSQTAASLDYWWDVASKEQPVHIIHQAGSRMPTEDGTLAELLAQDWDVIILQQYSEMALIYQTYNPSLRHLIDLVLQCCPNPAVTFAWQMPWSYNDTYVPSMSNYVRWLRIGLATQQMIVNDGIDLIIPVGTAIQNARNTMLNGESQLTRDGWHLDRGVGRYIAACTWVQTLFAPVYGFSVFGNGAIPQMEAGPSDTYPSQPVTESNRTLCQQCAVDAVLSPFEVKKAY